MKAINTLDIYPPTLHVLNYINLLNLYFKQEIICWNNLLVTELKPKLTQKIVYNPFYALNYVIFVKANVFANRDNINITRVESR